MKGSQQHGVQQRGGLLDAIAVVVDGDDGVISCPAATEEAEAGPIAMVGGVGRLLTAVEFLADQLLAQQRAGGGDVLLLIAEGERRLEKLRLPGVGFRTQ